MDTRVIGIVSTGKEALSSVSRRRPDLVMVDIQLKGEKMDGIEVATAIQADHQVLVIYLTASVDDETIQREMDTFPEGFLVKPFGEQDLKKQTRCQRPQAYKMKTEVPFSY